MAPNRQTLLISIDSETGSYWYGDNKVQAEEKISALIKKASPRKNTFSLNINLSTQRFSSIKCIQSGCSMS
jgi:hypothetical protein